MTKKLVWKAGLSILWTVAVCTFHLAGQAANPLLTVSHYKLKNGLDVILSEDYALPVVSVAVAYNVGSIHESPGKTGLAYLMENLMFSGSANVAPFQHINFIHRIGGTFNATSAEDRTVFYQTVPSNRLALVLWLESDRMRFLDLGDAAIAQGRSALLDEMRQRKATEPYFESGLAFDQLLYSEFAFSHSLRGTENDIQNLSSEDVRNFYAAYFAPNNAVLCLTGNFNKLKARELIAQYFETLPRGRDMTTVFEPPLTTKQQVVRTFEDGLAEAPAFHMGFRLTSPKSNDFYTLALLDYVLLRGRSSRITRRLLNADSKIAYRMSGGIEKRKNRSVYKIFAAVNNETMSERCQAAIFSELDRLKTSFLSEKELDRYKTLFREDFLARLATTADKALFLCESVLASAKIEDAAAELDKYMRVQASDIVGIVARYFTPDNSVILNVKMR